MSREIKFRAWDEIGKWMGNVTSFDFDEGAVFIETKHSDDENRFEINNVPVMQFTGLKDKNGMEIYEGDIIYWEIDNGVGIESYTAIVKWSENLVKEGWSQTYKWLVGYTKNYYRGSYDELSTPAAYNDELQVIGNIYENPELLEETA